MQEDEAYQTAIDCIDRLINKIKPETSSKMKSCVVALYTADHQGKLRYSSEICLLHLDIDRILKTSFLRFYDLDTIAVLLEVELFFGFMESYKLKDAHHNLWGFDMWSEGTINIQFRNELQANIFYKKLEQIAPKRSELLEISKKQVQEELRKRKENSFFGKLKSKLFSKQEKVRSSSVVLEVVKSNSVTFDSNGNFKAELLSPEWQDIIRKSGLRPSDMKNKDIAKIVLEETIVFETKKAAEANPAILKQVGLKKIQELEQEDPSSPISTSDQKEEGKQELRESLSTRQNSQFVLPPQKHPQIENNRISVRQNLLTEFRNSNIQLKQVKTDNGLIQIESCLNKEQRNDLAELIKKRLRTRKLVLNRRHSSDQD